MRLVEELRIKAVRGAERRPRRVLDHCRAIAVVGYRGAVVCLLVVRVVAAGHKVFSVGPHLRQPRRHLIVGFFIVGDFKAVGRRRSVTAGVPSRLLVPHRLILVALAELLALALLELAVNVDAGAVVHPAFVVFFHLILHFHVVLGRIGRRLFNPTALCRRAGGRAGE